MTSFSSKDIKFMNIALSLAKIALNNGDIPVGAIIVKDDLIIGKGYNLSKLKNDPTLHAEVVAIKDTIKKYGIYTLKDSTIYTTLEPCMFCFGLINQVKIGKIIFGAYDKNNGVCGGWQDFSLLKPFYNKVIVLGGLLSEESQQLLKNFFKSIRKK